MASIQCFKTLGNKVTEDLQNQLSDKDNKNNSVEKNKYISDMEIADAIEEVKNVNSYLYSIEALIEVIIGIKVTRNLEYKFLRN